MSKLIEAVLNSEEKSDLRSFLSELRHQEKRYLLRNDILNAYNDYCYHHSLSGINTSSNLGKLIYYTQEIIQEDSNICLIIRPKIASQEIYRLTEDLTVELMTVEELLDLRDRFVNRYHPNEGDLLELDFQSFHDYSPSIRDAKNIGKGVQFLNRYLSSKLFGDPKQWMESLFNFLRLHQYNGIQLLINPRIQSQQQLSAQVKKALSLVSDRPSNEPYENFRFVLQMMGFEAGWGNTASRVQETLSILDELVDSPAPQTLEAFISRIPMIFKIVLVSPHGWFGQEGVVGRPDTGGQVVYVLDQAKSLEKQLQEDIFLAGLQGLNVQPKVIILTRLIPNNEGTSCNQRLEKVNGAENAWILRVPLREFNPHMTQNWMSRFELWPYLETFAIDSERELLAQFQGRPDLIVGNYSGGNLIAFLLSRRLKITQCNIAHSLEKPKYLFSNLYWQDLEEKYHFSLQFTADLIAMNSANFVISSTYQEIVGTEDSIGQYESYKCFTMPDLYHVVDGIDLFSPKFNVVPPGVNENYYFPYTRTADRIESVGNRIQELLFTLDEETQVFGTLDDPQKRPIFSVARLDRIKNLAGLIECFGRSSALQEHCNLIIVTNKLRTEASDDNEERDEIHRLYHLIEEYQLQGKIRWIGMRLSKTESGEIYRLIADRQGIFVQPALFEAFGLTVLEAMISGLPTFATQFGGPIEIIQDQTNGFYINPTNLEETASKILNFVTKCEDKPDYWQQISRRAIERVFSTYTWKIHTTKLLSLARIYGFWNFTSQENREDLLRYLEALFYLIYKPRAQNLLEQHKHRF